MLMCKSFVCNRDLISHDSSQICVMRACVHSLACKHVLNCFKLNNINHNHRDEIAVIENKCVCVCFLPNRWVVRCAICTAQLQSNPH